MVVLLVQSSLFRFSHRSEVFGLDFNFFVLFCLFFLMIVLDFDFVLVS